MAIGGGKLVFGFIRVGPHLFAKGNFHFLKGDMGERNQARSS